MKNAIPPISRPAAIKMIKTVLVDVEVEVVDVDVDVEAVVAVVCAFASSSALLPPVRFENASLEALSPLDPDALEPPTPFSASAFASAS